jgi:hypothetical protein
MNENLQNALTSAINKSLSAVETAESFLTPEVLRQLLLWHGVKNFIFFLLGVVVIVFIVLFNKWQIKKVKEIKMQLFDNPLVCANFFQIFWAYPLIYFLNIEWLQIWIVPKVWLIEYIANLAK